MPTIKKPNQHFDATLYTGTGSAQTITNAGGFQPDFVWMKGRSNVRNNNLYDSVRGTTKELNSNTTGAETTNATGLTAFNSNGWTIGSDGGINTSSETYVAWQWKAGGSTTVNTSGSISSNVSVNTTAGFSVVTYTGTGANATVGHGLGVAPKMIIIKSRSSALLWPVWHTSLANTEYLTLNLTSAKTTEATTVWNSTTPTSSVFSIGSATGVNTNGGTYVAYCWAEIAGFSKFGSYTGNGSTDGPMIFTGFQPKYILIKSTATANSWRIIDTARNPYNTANSALWANESTAEATGSTHAIDILSNGFKIRNSTSETNNSGTTLIYAAFAEAPFKYANAR